MGKSQFATLPVPAERETNRRYTYDEMVAEFPESNQPCELWDGEIIMAPSPSFFHQEISLRFYRSLYLWVSKRKLGKVVAAPIDMVLSPHRCTQPDVVFVSKGRLAIVDRVIKGAANLVAEVVSLGDRRRDRIEKRDLYEQYGVKEYWIIDPEALTVEVLCLEQGRYRLMARAKAKQIARSKVVTGFECSAEFLFADD